MAHAKNKSLPPGVTIKSGRYYRVQYLWIENGKRRQKWHPLSRVEEGLAALYRALSLLADEPSDKTKDIPHLIPLFLRQTLPRLSMAEQKETSRMGGEISEAFSEFNITQAQAKHILLFLNQWTLNGKARSAQRYRAILSKFFRWAILQGYRTDNPVDAIRLKSPPARDRYVTDEEFIKIRAALAVGDDGRKNSSGEMMQIFVDLLYLTGQRATDVRQLRWEQIDEKEGVIKFKPSKTIKSSGAKVNIPITKAICRVIDRAKELRITKSMTSAFVIHTSCGTAYTSHGVGSAWERARRRAGVENATLKDLRAKHASDAERAGYRLDQIQDTLAHEDSSTTRTYLKQRMPKRSAVELSIPAECENFTPLSTS